MDGTRNDIHESRDTAGRGNCGLHDREERCPCSREGEQEENPQEEKADICCVLMHSQEYGTEVWLCGSLAEAVQTLGRLARSAEQHRRRDGIQRYFCIKGSDLPAQEEPVGSEPVEPDLPDAVALTLTVHRRETCHRPMSHFAHERDMRELVRLLCEVDEEKERASKTAEYVKTSEVEA